MKKEYGLFQRKVWFFSYIENEKRKTKSTGKRNKTEAQKFVKTFLKSKKNCILGKIYKPKTWYFWYYDRHKKITKTTGKILKYEAEEFVKAFLKDSKREKITFKEFTKDFFLWDSCQWVKKQLVYGRRLSKEHAKNKRAILINHLLPHFGDFYIHEITKADIEDFLINLKKSNQTRNHILHALRQIMKEAEDRGMVEHSKAQRVRAFSVNHKETSIFTHEELKAMFPDDEQAIIKIWWDWKHAALFIILAATGIRPGEGRALHWIDLLSENILFIHRAVKDDQGTIGKTKTENQRIVGLSSIPCMYLNKWAEIADDTNLMFPNEQGKPYARYTLNRKLTIACKRAGINKKDRVVRSFRHSFNTRYKNILTGHQLRFLTGHKSERMTNHYDHPAIPDLIKRNKQAIDIMKKGEYWNIL